MTNGETFWWLVALSVISLILIAFVMSLMEDSQLSETNKTANEAFKKATRVGKELDAHKEGRVVDYEYSYSSYFLYDERARHSPGHISRDELNSIKRRLDRLEYTPKPLTAAKPDEV